MDKGKIVQTGTPHEILYHPANDFVKDFFDSGRLILEYKIATLKDVAPYLKVPLSTGNQLACGNVWEALQVLSKDSRDIENYEALIQAFNRYRKLQIV